jgi:hypothetical protein
VIVSCCNCGAQYDNAMLEGLYVICERHTFMCVSCIRLDGLHYNLNTESERIDKNIIKEKERRKLNADKT